MPFRDPATGKVFNTIREAVENYRCPGPCAECPLGQKVGGINGCDNGKWFDDHPIETARLMGYEVIDDKEVNMDKQDKPLSEWTLGEAKAECCGRTPANKTKCVECPLIGKVCYFWNDELEVDSPDGWKIDGKAEAKPEREGLGPSPTRETEAPDVDVGAGSKPARPRLAELLGVEVGHEFAVKTSYGMSEKFILGSDGFVRKSKDGIVADGYFFCQAINHPENIVRATLTEPEIAAMRALGAKWVSRNIDDDYDDVSLWSERPERVEKTFFGSEADIANRWIAQIATELFPSVKPGDCIGVEEAAHALKNPG